MVDEPKSCTIVQSDFAYTLPSFETDLIFAVVLSLFLLEGGRSINAHNTFFTAYG